MRLATRAWYGMEWNGNFGVEYGRYQNGINGMKDFKNGMENKLPYFHTNSVLDFVHCIYRKNMYGYRVVINNIVTEVFNFNLRVLFVDRLRYFGCVYYASSVLIASLYVSTLL